MGRSGHLSGATVALELLPKALPVTSAGPLARLLRPANLADRLPETLDGLCLASDKLTVPLASLADIASFGPDAQSTKTPGKAPAGDLLADLDQSLRAILDSGTADADALYRTALCLARLNRHKEGGAILALVDTNGSNHPAVLALKGYLGLQNGDVEAGRRALARAALASRGSSDNRSILHFTQHVLLAHQFGG